MIEHISYNLAIIGSRSFTDYDFAKSEIYKILSDNGYIISNIISGGAKGADKIAEIYAAEYNIPTKIFKPDWSIGKHAGHLRNTTIIENSDIIIAFWNGTSTGTLDSINKAKRLNKILFIVSV